MSKITKIAIPSINPGGLDALFSPHFGQSDCFSILSFDENKKFLNCEIIQNQPHIHGQCLSTVNLLIQNNVNAVIVAGIGQRPLHGLLSNGISVYTTSGTFIKDIKTNYENGNIILVDQNFTCQHH